MKRKNKTNKIKIWPGSSQIAIDCGYLFGFDRVIAGSWGSPVKVHSLSDEEVKMAEEYFDEYNVVKI